MSKYPFISIRLPKNTDAKTTRADFAAVAARHGYSSNYHKNSLAGSPGEFILAINNGEVVVCPFMDEWYSAAISRLRFLADVGEAWAESLIAAIEAAQSRTALLAKFDYTDQHANYPQWIPLGSMPWSNLYETSPVSDS